jgi:FHA domain
MRGFIRLAFLSSISTPYLIAGAILVLALIIGLVAFFLFRGSGKKKTGATPAAGAADWQRQQAGAGGQQAPWGQQNMQQAPWGAQQPGPQGGWGDMNAAQQQQGGWGMQAAPAAPQQPSAPGWGAPAAPQQPAAGWGAPAAQPQSQQGAWDAQNPQQPAGWGAPSSPQQAPAGWGNPAQQQQSGWGPQGAAGMVGGQQPWDQQQVATPQPQDPWGQQQQQQQAMPAWGTQQGGQPQAPTAYGSSGSGQSWGGMGQPQAAPGMDAWGQPVQPQAQPVPQAQQGSWPGTVGAAGQQPMSPPPGSNAAMPSWQQPGFPQGQPAQPAQPGYGAGFDMPDADRTVLGPAGARGPASQGHTGMVRIEEGKEPGRIYEVRKESLSIGRSRESDIFLEDLAVSRLHASIISMGNGNFALRDEGSANGTKVNGQAVNKYQPYPLQEGDKIQLGQTVLVFARR